MGAGNIYGQRESLIGPSQLFTRHAAEAARKAITAGLRADLVAADLHRSEADVWERAAAMSEAWERLAAAVWEAAEEVLNPGFETEGDAHMTLRRAMDALAGRHDPIASHMEATRR